MKTKTHPTIETEFTRTEKTVATVLTVGNIPFAAIGGYGLAILVMIVATAVFREWKASLVLLPVVAFACAGFYLYIRICGRALNTRRARLRPGARLWIGNAVYNLVHPVLILLNPGMREEAFGLILLAWTLLTIGLSLYVACTLRRRAPDAPVLPLRTANA